MTIPPLPGVEDAVAVAVALGGETAVRVGVCVCGGVVEVALDVALARKVGVAVNVRGGDVVMLGTGVWLSVGEGVAI